MSKKLIEGHLNEAMELSETSVTLNICDIRLEDDTLHFTYDNGNDGERETFTFMLTEYPGGSNMLFASKSSDPKSYKGTILEVLKQVSKEYNAKNGVDEDEAMPDSQLDEEGYEEGDDENMGSDGMEDDAEGWEEEYATEMSYKENQELTLEVENHQKIFGRESISTRPMPLLETVDVEINVPYRDILSDSCCSAWGINHNLPIILKISVSADYFLDARDEPKIEVYQERNAKKVFRLKYQLAAVILKYIKEIWPHNCGKKIRAEEFQETESLKRSASESGSDLKSSGTLSRTGSLISKVLGREEKKPKKTARDADVSQLVDMGFSIEMSNQALKMSRDLEEATNLLLSDPESVERAVKVSQNSKLGKSEVDPKAPTIMADRIDELFSSPEKALTSDHTKIEISSKYGFLVMVTTYLRFRMPNLNNFCVICDQPHVFAHGNMLKPAVCARELCCFAFQQLGVGSDAADDIATAAEVVDLLVCFATIAAASPRNTMIFEPYPTIFDPKDPKKTIFHPNSKDFIQLSAVLSKFPSVEKMSQAKDFADMKKQMDKAHEHAYSLLQWIITSNRSHLVKMNSNNLIKGMQTTHQYLLLSAAPEKEAKFRQMKEKHGSIFAFHGSPIENWHAILRTGLKNASGTKLQINGAAYGSGIYLSPAAATSFGYCRMQGSVASSHSANRFLDTKNIHCIAICEVIDKDIRKNSNIWVQPDPEFVVTRFFFVFTGMDTSKAQAFNTENTACRNEILAALKSH